MAKLIVDKGDRFGRWTVIEYIGTIPSKKNRGSAALVKCDCGFERIHFVFVLKNKMSTSCGCYQREAQSKRRKDNAKHNLSKHPLYQVWRGMKARCLNKNDKAYHYYGGRGITICKDWETDFVAFYDWAIKNGWERGLKNDRVDNNLGYSPQNCRFVDDATSMRNTRRNFNIELNGVIKCGTDWANDLSITVTSLKKRIKNWGIEKALTTPKLSL